MKQEERKNDGQEEDKKYKQILPINEIVINDEKILLHSKPNEKKEEKKDSNINNNKELNEIDESEKNKEYFH